ncbi:Mitochondrial acidic protein mam33 [Coemansia sp. RSA 552]|nr:Mitochondrial acidic protein mam33 [Coemansia sp. RSA 552]
MSLSLARNFAAAAARASLCAGARRTSLVAAAKGALHARPGAIRGPAVSIRGLSTTPALRANGAADSDLAHTLSDEIQYEAKQAEDEGTPEFIEAFAAKTGFKITSKVGECDVTMTKQFGSERITVIFDVSEILNNENPIANIGVYRENDAGEVVKEAEKRADEGPEDFPISFVAVFAKPNAPVLYMDLEASEGDIGIDHMRLLPDEKTAIANDAEADWRRDQSYLGPVYGELSDDLKENVDAFLRERSIDTALVLFLQDYIEYKEQGEYLHWLKQFKSFVDA